MITIALLLVLLVLFSIALSGNGWSNVLSPDRNELVFADRNREYGAYKIRQEHHRTMILAFFISLGLAGILAFLPRMFQSEALNVVPPMKEAVSVDLIFDTKTVKPQKETVKVKEKVTVSTAKSDDQKSNILVALDSAVAVDIDTTTMARPVLIGDTATTGNDVGDSSNTQATTGTGTDPGGKDTGPMPSYAPDVQPEYPGGEKALYAYLKNTLKYPEIAKVGGRSGRVVVGFVVAADGSVTDISILKGVSPAIDAEAIRVVRKMIKWHPGKFKGQDVAVRFSLPIVFTLK